MAEDVLNASAQGRLKSIVERIERLEEDFVRIRAELRAALDHANG